jgi:hypothetical protein
MDVALALELHIVKWIGSGGVVALVTPPVDRWVFDAEDQLDNIAFFLFFVFG